jgi:hypothetical protein
MHINTSLFLLWMQTKRFVQYFILSLIMKKRFTTVIEKVRSKKNTNKDTLNSRQETKRKTITKLGFQRKTLRNQKSYFIVFKN